MIHLSRLDGSAFVLNADRIEIIEGRPDTVITSIDGKHYVVREHVDDVVARVLAYQQRVHQCALRVIRSESREAADG